MRSTAAPVDCSISCTGAGWPGFITMATKNPSLLGKRGRYSEQQIENGGLLNIRQILISPFNPLLCTLCGAGGCWVSERAAYVHKLLTHLRSFHAGRSAVVPRCKPTLRSPHNRWQRTGDGCVFISRLGPFQLPLFSASHLPLSISEPPGRPVRDGSAAPLFQIRPAEGL